MVIMYLFQTKNLRNEIFNYFSMNLLIVSNRSISGLKLFWRQNLNFDEYFSTLFFTQRTTSRAVWYALHIAADALYMGFRYISTKFQIPAKNSLIKLLGFSVN